MGICIYILLISNAKLTVNLRKPGGGIKIFRWKDGGRKVGFINER